MSTHCYISKTQTGFTLIEVVITAAIIAMLATITALSTFQRDPLGYVHNGEQIYVTALELARNNATTGHTCCGDLEPNAYGIYTLLDNSGGQEFFMYAEFGSDNEYTAGTDVVVQRYNLDSVVTFSQCATDTSTYLASSGTPVNCDVQFYQSDVYMNGVSQSGASLVSITFQHTSVSSANEQAIIHPSTLIIQ